MWSKKYLRPGVVGLGLIWAGLFTAGTAWGDLSVSRLFSDHMVVQRNAEVSIWGKSDAGVEVTARLGELEGKAVTDADGNWTVRIRTGEAGGPFDLSVSTGAGDPKVSFSDVMVGDVFLCSGQSNMEWSVAASAYPEKEISNSVNHPQVRLCTVNQNASIRPLDEPARLDGWHVCAPQTVAGFSATAYFFARNYQQATGVPVGVVVSAWGGTPCEAWTAVGVMQTNPALKSIVDAVNLEEPRAEPHFPGSLFNGMIAPVRKMRFTGILWYQGESNVGRAEQYAELFPAMIANWREVLADATDLPFYFVQLAPFRYGGQPPEALAGLWEAQLKTLRNVPHCGMAVTTDIGNFTDIHPGNKQEVGRRLALWALQGRTDAKGKPIEEPLPSGPLYRSQRVDGNTIVLEFDHVGGGLKASDGEALREFQITGPDGVFVPAEAKIAGETVVVSSAQVAQPVAVRFAWNDTPSPNLVNQEGLPASPFRTSATPESGKKQP